MLQLWHKLPQCTSMEALKGLNYRTDSNINKLIHFCWDFNDVPGDFSQQVSCESTRGWSFEPKAAIHQLPWNGNRWSFTAFENENATPLHSFFCKSAMTMVERKVTSCFWRWLHDHVTAACGRRSLPLRWAAALSRQRKPPLRGSVGWVAPSLVLKKAAWQNEVKYKNEWMCATKNTRLNES